jgi:ABC-type bacteriocin/lantibiotic exporter with double-glycine peptidase domain
MTSARCCYFAPEVIQASAMDCGPASLRCLLAGFNVCASLGRLREACQTGVDGSSIDTLEDVAGLLGLDAQQVMVPVDHVPLAEAETLPALVVVQLPGGFTHFVVAWRRFGSLLQIMDPARGRRWTMVEQFLPELYVHTTEVEARAWREWAGGEEFQNALQRRLGDLGISRSEGLKLAAEALADDGWRALGILDAAARMTAPLVRSGGVRRGGEALCLLRRFLVAPENIPAGLWSVRSTADHDRLSFKGAVMVRVRGRKSVDQGARELTPELAAALSEAPSRPGLELVRLLRADGILAPATLLCAMALAAGVTLLEAVLFRGLFDLGRELGVAGQRIAAVGEVALLLAALLLLELPLTSALLRAGRRLEARMRVAFLEKIPKLGDRYFQSRLKSDMAERSHSIHRIRRLPEVGGRLVRNVFELLMTAAGITWLDPAAAPCAWAAAALALALPLVAQPLLGERDLRVRSQAGALSRYYLDAFLGLVALRAHGGEGALRKEHESVLQQWARASFALQRAAVGVEAIQLLIGFGLAAWLLIGHLERHGESGGVLLLVYWALNLAALAQGIAEGAWQYPALRSSTLRLLEPLGAIEEDPAPAGTPLPRHTARARGMALRMEAVTVRASGHTILQDIELEIGPGSHVAIVGPSGAGKSSLMGLLLGWHRPAEGRAWIDGQPLDDLHRASVRREIAWLDPSVHLWNRSLADNLTYGSTDSHGRMGMAVENADLQDILEALPEGFETRLGEGGALLSGGQGQRVRAGRALLRRNVRLAILDEPFRGLDREKRRDLLARARNHWKDVTLLCITHDVGETLQFPRVLVVEAGRIVEDGAPCELAAAGGSRYRALLDAEKEVRDGFWNGPEWRRLRLADGAIAEEVHTKVWEENAWLTHAWNPGPSSVSATLSPH